ncbi:MAG: CHAT domain-containing protein [Prolixibacteraceae bacterium]|nr:CHAT domain-containing protein [Prolixibacteraceae bacterium]
MANSYVFLGDFKQGIPILEELDQYYRTRNEQEYLYNLLFLARAYTRSGEIEKAEKHFNIALPLLTRIKAEKDPWFIFYHELYGQLLMLKAEKAVGFSLKQAYYTDALAVFDKALLLNSRSQDQKIPYLEGTGDVINPTQVKDVFQFRTRVLKNLGELYETSDAWLLARDYYHQALQSATATTNFLHDFRISFIDEESKINLGEKEEDVYTEGLQLAEYLYRETGLPSYFESMLHFMEAGKSAVFLASLNDIQAKNFGGIPDSLIEQERSIHLQLNSLKQARFDQQNTATPDSLLLIELNKSIFRLQNRQEALNFLLERDFPEYYRFKYRDVTLGSAEICSALSARQALIEYFIDEPLAPGDSGNIYALLFHQSGYSYVKTPISYAFIEKLQEVLSELTEVNIGDTRLSNFKRLTLGAHYLYQHLIAPLPINDKVRELVIIPDGKLAYFPFDILLSSLPDQQKIDFRTPDYLVYQYNVTYSYSATLHFEYFKKNRRRGHHILAYAPDYGETEVNINDAAYRDVQSTRTRLRPLPGAREEVLGLSAYQDCKAFFGTEATETSFKQQASNFDILHLAMHTIVNDSLPMFSKLVFSNHNDSLEDGYLNTQEIYNMKLDARLAVLSACNTGTGKLRGGEGVMSLSRAFLYAGCPSIVMTLWEVEDKVSADIMLRFYHYLFRGFQKSEALRRAKLDHIKNADPLKAHPYFWQGYILVGDPSPIKFNNNVIIGMLGFIAILIFFAHFLVRMIRRHKKNSAS